MNRAATIILALFAACALRAAPVCIDGVCYPSEEAARAAGAVVPAATQADGRRLAMGYMDVPEMMAFLRNETPRGRLEDHALWLVLLLVLAGGLAANLTPCVLPLVPINLILIGKGWRRGAAYAAGITTAYGALGLAAAFGGLAFGTLQSSPWFNGGVAAVFAVLALAMLEIVRLPELRALKKGGGRQPARPQGFVKAYLLGLGAATLAGACVEPILIATLLLTAKWFAAGRVWAVALPFVLGAGMGLPYPFAAAGLSVLPRPGAWMVWVKRTFAVVFAAMSIWYGRQMVGRFGGGQDAAADGGVRREGEAARMGERPAFVKIGAPWCRNCAAMARTTFRDPEVVQALAAFDVREIEIDGFADLARHPELKGLDIKGLPAYVIIENTETSTQRKEEKK